MNPPIRSDVVANCSVVGAVDALGDLWSVLVLRELFHGVHRFSDMIDDLGISRSVLTDRIKRLVDLGLVRPRDYQEPGARVRQEYHLTRKGAELQPVLVALMAWGDRHVNDGTGPFRLVERSTGQAVHLELRTADDRPVGATDVAIEPT